MQSVAIVCARYVMFVGLDVSITLCLLSLCDECNKAIVIETGPCMH